MIITGEVKNSKPIKRSAELSPLSRDHHNGLLLCWKIRTGISKKIDPLRISSYIIDCFKNDLDNHFMEEEQYVFPLLESENTERQQAENQHKELRSIVSDLSNTHMAKYTLLKDFADLLEEHIRFEERVLFGIIEDRTDKETLMGVGKTLEKPSICKTEWVDNFWLTEKK